MKSKLILGSTAALAGMAFGAKANVAHADAANTGSTQTISQMNTSTNTASQAPTVSTPVQSSGSTANSSTTNVGSTLAQSNVVANNTGSASTVKAPVANQPVAQQQTANTSNTQQGHPVEQDATVSNTNFGGDGVSDYKTAPTVQDPFATGAGATDDYQHTSSINGDDWLNQQKKDMYHITDLQSGSSLNVPGLNGIDRTPYVAKVNNGSFNFNDTSGKQLPNDMVKSAPGTNGNSNNLPYTNAFPNSGLTDAGVGTCADKQTLWGINPSTGAGLMIDSQGNWQPVYNNGQQLLHADNQNIVYIGYDAKPNGKDDPYSVNGSLTIQDRGNGFVEIYCNAEFMSANLIDSNGKLSVTGVNSFPEALMLEDAKVTKNADGSVTVSGKVIASHNDIHPTELADNPTEWTHTFVNNLLAEPSNANNGSSSSTPAAGSSSTNSSSSSTPSNSSSSTPAGNTNSSTSSSITSSSTTTPSSSTSTGSTADSNSSTPTSSNTNDSSSSSINSSSSTVSDKVSSPSASNSANSSSSSAVSSKISTDNSSSSSANNNLSSSTENSAVSDKTSTDNGDSSVESDNSSNSSTKSDAGSNSSANSSAENESSTASNVSSDTNNSTVTPNASSNSSASAGRSNSNSNNGLPDTGATSGVIALSVVAGLISASAVGAELIKKRA